MNISKNYNKLWLNALAIRYRYLRSIINKLSRCQINPNGPTCTTQHFVQLVIPLALIDILCYKPRSNFIDSYVTNLGIVIISYAIWNSVICGNYMVAMVTMVTHYMVAMVTMVTHYMVAMVTMETHCMVAMVTTVTHYMVAIITMETHYMVAMVTMVTHYMVAMVTMVTHYMVAMVTMETHCMVAMVTMVTHYMVDMVTDSLWTCFLDRRSFWNFTSEATLNKMFMCRWKSLKLMRSGNFKRF